MDKTKKIFVKIYDNYRVFLFLTNMTKKNLGYSYKNKKIYAIILSSNL